ncbi:hypothetical protein AX774_g5458 [Zancudomyces culisetae]|uniref:Nipped-B-like protein B n=1 Tax=Zancudomyces culisetae TaxID=1213189 RepID=A0A1R1PJN5_ZANCU|nr:hypothetical protein AX774_g5458 [Zancudomyces culisetae]|eukprot:OMH81092.1 hypothetical protein AX774_g5458 [Zancudomyces culisetae]
MTALKLTIGKLVMTTLLYTACANSMQPMGIVNEAHNSGMPLKKRGDSRYNDYSDFDYRNYDYGFQMRPSYAENTNYGNWDRAEYDMYTPVRSPLAHIKFGATTIGGVGVDGYRYGHRDHGRDSDRDSYRDNYRDIQRYYRGDGYRDNGRDYYRDNERDDYRDHGRIERRGDRRDGYRYDSQNGYRDHGRGDYRDDRRDSYRDNGRDSYRDNRRDDYRDDRRDDRRNGYRDDRIVGGDYHFRMGRPSYPNPLMRSNE